MDDIAIGDLDRNNVCQLPISSAANDANEEGVPLSLSRPIDAKNELDALSQLAEIVSKELFRLPFKPENSGGIVSFEDSNELFELTSIQLSLDGDSFLLRAFSEKGALQKRLSPKDLRSRNPKNGALVDSSKDEGEIKVKKMKLEMVEIHRASAMKGSAGDVPVKVEKKGKVGYEVTWSDGAKFIYSRRAIAMAGQGRIH